MADAVILDREERFYCPNCHETAVRRGALPAPGSGEARMHYCAGLRGLLAPLIPAGVKCKVEANEREDYEGLDTAGLTRDGEGRPIMNVVTTRDDGNDCMVFAPTVIGRVEV